MISFKRFFLVTIVLGYWSEGAFANLNRADLDRQYQGLKGFSGKATQIRRSPYLLKPLRSEVEISYRSNVLTWQVHGQEKFEIRFEPNKAPVLSGNPELTAHLPAPAKAKLLDTLLAFRSLMLLEPKLDEDFQLTINGNELVIVPRSKRPEVFFQEIILLFDAERQLQSMTLKTKDEETLLKFSELKWFK